MLDRQRATALYFIDKLALRAGGEKDTEEEADTVGCCNLRVEHVQCMPDLKIQFDFLGKDSIQYLNTVEVVPQVYKNIQVRPNPRLPAAAVPVSSRERGAAVRAQLANRHPLSSD
jgi:DNA topoisomerase IB